MGHLNKADKVGSGDGGDGGVGGDGGDGVDGGDGGGGEDAGNDVFIHHTLRVRLLCSALPRRTSRRFG